MVYRTAAAVLLCGLPVASPSPLAVAPGPRPVGFRVINFLDVSRRGPAGGPRPVQVSVWYPAGGTGAGTLTYRDYVLVAAGERSTAVPAAEALERYRSFAQRNGVPAAGLERWLAAPMLAARDAPPMEGQFPVVLVGQGLGGAVHDQAVLGEHLASRGYVVATTPSPVRLGFPMQSEADVLPLAREQARDLAVALERLRGWPSADTSAVALVGYSFGARPALLLAATLPEARALVSLDGGIGAQAAREWLPAAFLDRRSFRVPTLHVWQDGDPAVKADLGLLESLVAAPRTLMKVEGLRHLDLITFGVAAARFPTLGEAAPERLRERLAAVFAATDAFLRSRLEGEEAPWRAFLATPGPGRLELRALSPAR